MLVEEKEKSEDVVKADKDHYERKMKTYMAAKKRPKRSSRIQHTQASSFCPLLVLFQVPPPKQMVVLSYPLLKKHGEAERCGAASGGREPEAAEKVTAEKSERKKRKMRRRMKRVRKKPRKRRRPKLMSRKKKKQNKQTNKKAHQTPNDDCSEHLHSKLVELHNNQV